MAEYSRRMAGETDGRGGRRIRSAEWKSKRSTGLDEKGRVAMVITGSSRET